MKDHKGDLTLNKSCAKQVIKCQNKSMHLDAWNLNFLQKQSIVMLCLYEIDIKSN